MQISSAKAILFQQQTAWSQVMEENAERQNLLNYGIMMTLIANAMSFIGGAFIVGMVSFVVGGFPMAYFLVSSAIQAGLGIVFLYIVPQILGNIALQFSGQNNQISILKLYVFSMTPVWVGMMTTIVPVIGWLTAIAGAVYGVYLFWQHCSQATGIPEEKKVMFVVASVIAIGVIGWLISAAAHFVAASMFVTTTFSRGSLGL